MSEDVSLDRPDLRARSLSRVVLMGWHGPPRAETIREVKEKMVAHHAHFSDGVVIVNVARGGAPDERARGAFRELAKAAGKSVIGVFLVLPAGLAATVARSVVSAINFTSRLSFRIEVVASPEEGAARVAQLLAKRGLTGPPENELLRALAEVAEALPKP